MIHDMQRVGFLGRIWQFFLAPAQIAVTIYYDAPWLRMKPVAAVPGKRLSALASIGARAA